MPLPGSVPLDPKQSVVFVTAPSSKFGMVENPLVRILQQTALDVLDAFLVVARVGRAQVCKALAVILRGRVGAMV